MSKKKAAVKKPKAKAPKPPTKVYWLETYTFLGNMVGSYVHVLVEDTTPEKVLEALYNQTQNSPNPNLFLKWVPVRVPYDQGEIVDRRTNLYVGRLTLVNP